MKTKLITTLFMILIVLPMAFAGSWSGHVVDESLADLPGVNVDAILGGLIISSNQTDINGDFTVYNLTDGSYTLNFTKAGYINTAIDMAPKINNSHPLRTDLTWLWDIQLTQALPGAIAGFIYNSSGPMNGVIVTVVGTVTDSNATNVNGAYAINGLIDGVYDVQVSQAGYIAQTLSNVLVQPGMTTSNVNFTLVQGLSITSGPTISGITTTAATVSWTTNIASNSVVEYGTSTSYGTVQSNPAMVTSHSFSLSGLSAGTTYYYRINSTDATNYVASATGTFTTSSVTPPPGRSSGGGGGSSGTFIAVPSTAGPQTYKWDIAKEPIFIKTMRPIDSIIFDYEGTSFNLIVDKFGTETYGFRISPTDEKRSGIKFDTYDFTIKDKILLVSINDVQYNTVNEAQSLMKLTLKLNEGMKQNFAAAVTNTVKNGVIKVIGDIVPPKEASIPVGVGISIATLIVGLMLFLGLRLIWG